MCKLGIYIHIPFCIRKCAYCDFLSGSATVSEQNVYMDSIVKEICLTAMCYKDVRKKQVDSIFFGGGTPSSIEAYWIVVVLETIRKYYNVSSNVEITMECNPGTLTKEKIEMYKDAGVNRISLGLQSVHNRELELLGRIHTWEQFLESYTLVRQCGITNINIDLMSALPGQTMESWQDTLKKVTDLNPEHISAYSLIIEPETPFFDKYEEHPELLPSEEEDRAMYAWTKDWLKKQGYDRYEISNYAKKGKECRHNNFYWTGISYIGFGIGASSLYENIRYTNIENRKKYVEMLSNCPFEKLFDTEKLGKSCTSLNDLRTGNDEKTNFIRIEEARLRLHNLRREIHESTVKEQMEEFVFLGLRRMEGISKKEFQNKFNISIKEVYGEVISKYISQGFLECIDERIKLTDAGIDVSNVILADFLLDSE